MKWRICPRCRGEGKSSAHLGAFTAQDFAEEGQEFVEDYCRGAYDIPCEVCRGSGKVTKEDVKRWQIHRADKYQEWLESGRPEGSFDKWAGL